MVNPAVMSLENLGHDETALAAGFMAIPGSRQGQVPFMPL